MLLGPGQAAVADQEEERPGERRAAPLPPTGRPAPPQTGEAVDRRPRQQRACRHHEQRRQGLDGVADRQKGRPPDEVDRGKGRRQLEPRSQALDRSHRRTPSGNPASRLTGAANRRKLLNWLV